MIHLLESPLAQRLAWALLHFLWQGALVGLLARISFTLLRRRSPNLRYLLGCAFLVACLGSVTGTLLLLAPPTQPVIQTPGSHPTMAPFQALPLPFSVSMPQAAPLVAPLPWQLRLQPYLPWILAAWTIGVLGLSLRAAGGWLWLRRLKSTATPIHEPQWLKDLVLRTGLRRAVHFLESVQVATPICMGLLRPVVLLPLGFFANLDSLAAEAVLAHELAHLRRLDGLINGLQCVVEVLFFFHPAVWWLSRRIRTEREHCCDDAAVLACGDAIFYAETLSRLDTFRDHSPSLALQARGGNLMERLRRLLVADPPQPRLGIPSLTLLAVLVLFTTLPAQAKKSKANTSRIETAPDHQLPAIPKPKATEPPITTALPLSGTIVGPLTLASRSLSVPDLPNVPGQIKTPPSTPAVQIAEIPTPATQHHQPKTTTLGDPAQPQGDPALHHGSHAALPPLNTQDAPPVLKRSPAPATPTRSTPFAGAEPTAEEAEQIIQVNASQHPWGDNYDTAISQVKILGKERWNDAYLGQWPEATEKQSFIRSIKHLEGWVVSFQIRDPEHYPKTLTVLLTKDGVIHWRRNWPALPPGLRNFGVPTIVH